MNNLGEHMKLIQQNFNLGAYTIVAKECSGIIEEVLKG